MRKEKAKSCVGCEMRSESSLRCSCTGALQISQMPRFIGARTKQNVKINCSASAGTVVQWYKLNKYDGDRNRAVEVKKGGKIDIPSPGTRLVISGVRVEDKGVYFCKANGTWGPGTELQVVSKGTAERSFFWNFLELSAPTRSPPPLPEPLNRAKAQHRTHMKDGLIIFQALLLAVCTFALMLRKRALVRSLLSKWGLASGQVRGSWGGKKQIQHIFFLLLSNVYSIFSHVSSFQW